MHSAGGDTRFLGVIVVEQSTDEVGIKATYVVAQRPLR